MVFVKLVFELIIMRLKKFIAVLIGVMSVFQFSYAQNSSTLKATLQDENGEAVTFATVSLTKSGATKVYKYALSSVDGKVTIEKVAHGKYTIKAELLGYKEFTKDIEVKNSLDLGVIKMEEDKQTLDAASVSATGNPIIVKKDTIEYNASSFKTTENDMLIDLLKKLPGIGPKAAAQIVLDLKGKLVEMDEKGAPTSYEEVRLALKQLGFKVKEIDDVLSSINEPGLENDAVLRLALQKLRKKSS